MDEIKWPPLPECYAHIRIQFEEFARATLALNMPKVPENKELDSIEWRLRQMAEKSSADAITALRQKLNGLVEENETWEMLAKAEKGRAEKAEHENARLREAVRILDEFTGRVPTPGEWRGIRELVRKYAMRSMNNEDGGASASNDVLGAWQPIETAPASGLILLAVEDATGERRTFAAEASIDGDGALVWQITAGWTGWARMHSSWRAVLWRRLPQAVRPNVKVTGA